MGKARLCRAADGTTQTRAAITIEELREQLAEAQKAAAREEGALEHECFENNYAEFAHAAQPWIIRQKGITASVQSNSCLNSIRQG